MKKLLVSAFAGCAMMFGVASTSMAQKGVEISMQMKSAMMGEEPMHMQIFTKGDQTMSQIDMGAMGSMKSYVDRKNKKITMLGLMGQNLEMDMPENTQDTQSVDMKPTGKKDVINGFKSEEYTVTLDKGQTADAWLTSDLPKSVLNQMKEMQLSSMGSSGNMGGAMKKMIQNGMFFSRITMNVPQGGDVTMDVTKFEEKDLDDAMFKVPADAHPKHIDPKMMQRMGH